MARLIQGILGGISGKIGNVVGSSWKGIAIIKSKPLSVANPRTSGQIAQREKMSAVVAFAKVILASVIKPLWDRFAQQQSGYNAFVSENIDLFTETLPDPLGALVISKGKMTAVTPSSVSGAPLTDIVTINYPTNLPDSLALATDIAYVVFVTHDPDSITAGSNTATRATGTIDIQLPADMVDGNGFECYLAFRRADGTVVSNTGYLIDTL